MKPWEALAIERLKDSLHPVPHEKNDLDWKSELSTKSDRLAQHLSAFSNLNGGGFLVFGIDPSGNPIGLRNTSHQDIITKLGNIARQGLEPSIAIDHSIIQYEKTDLLIVRIPESPEKPVHLRGQSFLESFTRSAGQTRKLHRREIARLISQTSGTSFEQDLATEQLSLEELLNHLDIQSYFDLTKRPFPQTAFAIAESLVAAKLAQKSEGGFRITNLGAILFAKNLSAFDHLKRKAVRVVVYERDDRMRTLKEQEGGKGYASGFEGLVRWINDQLPMNEVIGQALRREVKMYPELAIRELVANALIHQDFDEIGSGPMIEIFSDRIEITNPGKPLVNALRLIDSPPQSRNDLLAALMRNMGMCEERGTGIDKVIFEVEVFQLPPPDFVESENHFKVVVAAHQTLSRMGKKDRVRACYQHCCLKYVSNQRMSNQTLRKRFNIEEKNYPMAWRIITETVEAGLIRPADPDNRSKKYANYIPFWA